MRHACALGVRRLRRADVHAPVHEHRVDRDDLGAERSASASDESGLADRGGSDERERRPSGHAGRLRRPRPPERDQLAGQVVRGAPTILACSNVPARARRDVHDAVRPRPGCVEVRACPPLHQHLERRAHLRERAFERDALLQLHQPVEPLLHDVLRDLVVERRRPRPGAASTGTCTRCRTGPARTTSRCRRSPPRSRREPDDDVRRHGDVGDRGPDRVEPSQVRSRGTSAHRFRTGPSPTAAGSGCARRRSRRRPWPHHVRREVVRMRGREPHTADPSTAPTCGAARRRGAGWTSPAPSRRGRTC
jgi:hypothetical protein